jgi:hypothetical protein
MTDKKQSAVARRLADTKVAPLYRAQETQLEELKTQVNKHESTLISLNSYSVALDQSISKDKDNITDLITRTDKLEIYTTLEQGTLAGRWSSSGTGYQQPVSIGYGLKLSNGGVLSAATNQVADATLSITAGNGLLGGGDLTQNRTISVNFAANGEVSSSKAVRADDSRLTGSTTSTGLFDIDGGDSGAYTGNPILDGGGA